MNVHDLDAHVERGLQTLCDEFSSKLPPEQVTRIGKARFEQLLANATINDFIPVLVYRQTREELLSCKPDELHDAA